MLAHERHDLVKGVLRECGGIVGFAWRSTELVSAVIFDDEGGVHGPRKALYYAAIDLVRETGYDDGEIKVDGSRIIVMRWDCDWIAVEVASRHPVNKSLQRIISKLRRKCGYTVVQSQACNPSQHVASSNHLDVSLGSPGGAIHSTGDSLEAGSSPGSELITQPSESLGRRRESSSGQVLT